jgi:hypothetical protein
MYVRISVEKLLRFLMYTVEFISYSFFTDMSQERYITLQRCKIFLHRCKIFIHPGGLFKTLKCFMYNAFDIKA